MAAKAERLANRRFVMSRMSVEIGWNGGREQWGLERGDFRTNSHRAPGYFLSMISSENRYPLFRIMP
jgi:hypothetical protein